jgi:hypothetical protein
MDKEDYQEWGQHPLTRQFHQFLMDYRQKLMEDWAMGAYNNQSMEVSSMQNQQMLGRSMMLQELCNLADDAISEFYRENRKGGSDVSAD